MKIVALSDLHGQLPAYALSPGNVLVIAGDVCPLSNHDCIYQRHWIENTFIPWLSCQYKTYEKIIMIAGNHDFIFETTEFKREVLGWLNDINVVYLENDVYEYMGVKFWGSPYQLACGRWAFGANENELAHYYKNIPKDTSVIISHGPPFRCLDRAIINQHVYDLSSVGSSSLLKQKYVSVGSYSLLEAIEKIKPDNVICGHIHEGYGQMKYGDTNIYNVSILNENYKMVNKETSIWITPQNKWKKF